jgi:hypothetical protein
MNNVNEVKPYSLRELSIIYDVCTKTLKKWMAPHREIIGKRLGRFYTALQVQRIFENVGLPHTVTISDKLE